MELQELLLKKEEFPIMYENSFYVPIHPVLLNDSIKLDDTLANQVFLQAAQEWYDDLKKHTETAELDKQTKEWYESVFLKKAPKIKKEYDRQQFGTGWADDTTIDSNGFARALSISRNGGGTLYFNREDRGCRTFVGLDSNNLFIKFSKVKIRAFGTEEHDLGNGLKGVEMHVYARHNVDFYPGALFLRNWAVLYENEALKQVFKK